MVFLMSCMEPGRREEYTKHHKLFISFVLEVKCYCKAATSLMSASCFRKLPNTAVNKTSNLLRFVNFIAFHGRSLASGQRSRRPLYDIIRSLYVSDDKTTLSSQCT